MNRHVWRHWKEPNKSHSTRTSVRTRIPIVEKFLRKRSKPSDLHPTNCILHRVGYCKMEMNASSRPFGSIAWYSMYGEFDILLYRVRLSMEKRKKRFPSITYSFPDAESLALNVLLIKNRFLEEISRSSPIILNIII